MLTEWLEKLVADAGKTPVAFDLGKSPFADLRDPTLPQWRLAPDKGIGDLCQGYVYLTPVDQLQRVRWMPGFITAETFAMAHDIAERIGIVEKGECQTAAELDARMLARFPRQP